MGRINLGVLILFVCLSHASPQSEYQSQYEIESFTFSLHWPVTVCKVWTNILHPGGQCVFPRKPNYWTVHGLWPKVINKPEGYCNDSWPLDRELMDLLEIKLNQTWINIYKESNHYSLWDHEWRKHGTCAASLQSLNTQFKYFNKGINWKHKYSIGRMLVRAGIFPSDAKPLTPDDVVHAVKAITKKLPQIVCATVLEVQYLDEVRICLDKVLNITDCNPVIFHTCDKNKGIIYPATV